MKVIFLDVDGVLNSSLDFFELHYIGHHVNKGTKVLNRAALGLLKWIIDETGAKIVLSSTWRQNVSLDEFHKLIMKHEVYIPRDVFVGRTGHHATRGLEVMEYIHQHPYIEEFVVLDDIPTHFNEAFFIHADYDKDIDEVVGENVVITNHRHGLEEYQAFRAIQILGRTEAKEKAFQKEGEQLDLLIHSLV